ncbi:MAG: hypothetical protein EBV15_04755 [Bacteroidetes bacterium]|nr:hypothetical protein [Bacteroidota bacterium]
MSKFRQPFLLAIFYQAILFQFKLFYIFEIKKPTMKTSHFLRLMTVSAFSMLLWACDTMFFDNAPAPLEDISKSGITNQIEGVYQISLSEKDSSNEIFTNNDFLINENIYKQFFKTPERTIEIPGEQTPLHIKSSISNDSIFIAIKMKKGNKKEDNTDTSFKIKIQKTGKLICINSKNNILAVDSISIKQEKDAKIYFAKTRDNLYLIKKDSAHFEINRTVINENGFEVYRFQNNDSLRKTNELPVKDSSEVVIYSEELLSKLKGSPFEILHLKAAKIKNFPTGTNNTQSSGNTIFWIIGIAIVFAIVLFIKLNGKRKDQLV